MSRFKTLKDGERHVVPKGHGLRLRCCDCGATHALLFRVTRAGLEFTATKEKAGSVEVLREKFVDVLRQPTPFSMRIPQETLDGSKSGGRSAAFARR